MVLGMCVMMNDLERMLLVFYRSLEKRVVCTKKGYELVFEPQFVDLNEEYLEEGSDVDS